MSYNPMSYAVLRNAMKWANLPACQFHKNFQGKAVDGTMTAIYEVQFKLKEVQDYLALHVELPAQNLWAFQQAVANSFCSDVTMMDRVVDDAAGTVTLYLYIRVPKHGVAD